MFSYTFIPAPSLPTYTGTVGSNVDFTAVVGNAKTVRIPAPTIFGQFVMTAPVPNGPEQDEGQHATTQLAVDSGGVYTYTSGSGWGKSPRVQEHWDDFTRDARLFVMHKQMDVSATERENARATLDIGIANRSRAGLVRESLSSEITMSETAAMLYQSVYESWGPDVYAALFDNDNYNIAFPEYSSTETDTWRAGISVDSLTGDAYVRYATTTRPGAVLIGGTNPLAAATMGSLAALAKWVVDYWNSEYKLAQSYEGTGAVDGVSVELTAGIIKADATGGTLLIREDGSAYVPAATTEQSGVVLVEEDYSAAGPGVPNMDTLRAFASALRQEIFTTYPGGEQGDAGVVIPRENGAVFQFQSISGAQAGSGIVDVRPASAGAYGAVYVADGWPAVNETSTTLNVSPPANTVFPDEGYSSYRKVPSLSLVWQWKQDIDARIGQAEDDVANINANITYASADNAGVIRYGRALTTEVSSSDGTTMVTNVDWANYSRPGVSYVVSTDEEYSSLSVGSDARVVPTVSYVVYMLDKYSAAPSVPVATSYTAGIVEVVEPGGEAVSTSGAPLVPTLSYLENAIAESGGSYSAISNAYEEDTITAGLLKQAIYDDVLNWVGAGDGGGGTGGTGSGSDNIYETLVDDDSSRTYREVQAAQQYANMARLTHLNYSITLGTSPYWLGNISCRAEVSTILDTVKSAAGDDYSIALYSAAATATYSAISQMYSGGRQRWANVYPYKAISYGNTGGLLENDLYGQVYNTILELISTLVYQISDVYSNNYFNSSGGILGYLRDNYSESGFGTSIATLIDNKIKSDSHSADLPPPGYTISGAEVWDSYSHIDTAIYSILQRLGTLESRVDQM